MSERKGYYESNMPANGIVIDTQDLEDMQASIRRMKADIQEGQELIERQRIAMDKLLKAVGKVLETYIGYGCVYLFQERAMENLREVYAEVSSASTMTGSSEQ